MVNWLPDMAIGSFTGQYQAGWHVTGNSRLRGLRWGVPAGSTESNQQGLVRFARRPISPGTEGPRFATSPWVPTLVPTSTTSLRVSWPTAYDRDDRTLTYEAIRVGVGTPRCDPQRQLAVVEHAAAGVHRHRPDARGDVQLPPRGQGPRWQHGERRHGLDHHADELPGGKCLRPGRARPRRADLLADERDLGPERHRPGGRDLHGPQHRRQRRARGYRGDLGRVGAIAGDTAASLGNNDFSRVYTLGQETAPNTFTIQVWIRTSTTSGGRILGFGDLQTGNTSPVTATGSSGWTTPAGSTSASAPRTTPPESSTSPLTYRNNQWHMVTATMGRGV